MTSKRSAVSSDAEKVRRRHGRVPIGGRHNISISASTKAELHLLAEPFGQRRVGAIVRIAIRRMLVSDVNYETLLTQRQGLDTERSIVPIFLGDDLTTELTALADQMASSRAELVRLACDLFLAELSTSRRRGVEADLTDEVNAEVYRGVENRDALIRRRMRAQARQQR